MNDNEVIRFDDQVVVITGAGGGLGRAYAHLLAARGARVVVNDAGPAVDGAGVDREPADAVVAEIRESGGEAVANYDSVASEQGGAAVVAAAIEHYGRLDGLIHNAGILRDRSFVKMRAEDVDPVLDVHLKAAFFVGRPAYEQMKAQQYGRIVLTTSASGLFGTFGQSNYGAAKAGLFGLMRVLNTESAGKDIRVNCIAPSARTRMTEELLGPLSEQLDPKHVAPLVAYLCSRQCDFGGEVFSAGGGRYARIFVGLTSGWYSGGELASVENVAARMDRIMATERYTIPASGMDELRIMLETFGLEMEAG